MEHMEKGRVTLTNTKTYPFNDSVKTIPLQTECTDNNYFVTTEIQKADGEVGDIEISGKALNGFKIAYTGSAKSVELGYVVIGE